MIAVLVMFGFIVAGLVGAGLVIGLIVTATAPVGYQDETGFHFGQERGVSEQVIHYAAPRPKLA
jgi:hypothetical protein